MASSSPAFQRLIAESSLSITRRGLELYAANPEKYDQLSELPFPAYLPTLAQDLHTPEFQELLDSAQAIFGRGARGLEGEILESLRRAFHQNVLQEASMQAWFSQEGGHSQRVARVAGVIAGEMGLSPRLIQEIRWGGLLHDIGKVFAGDLFETLKARGLPPEVTLPFIRSHASLGASLLQSVLPLFPTGLVCAAQHQESVDGSGYPYGLRYEQLSLEGKITNIADGYDATVTRLSWTAQQICMEVQQMYARASHPEAPVLHAFLRTVEKNHAAWYGA